MPQELTPDIIGQEEKFLIYGDPGTGKTFLSLTAPDPIYVLAVGGEAELKTRYSKQFLDRYPEKQIFFDPVRENLGERGSPLADPQGYDRACDAIDGMLEAEAKGDIPAIKTVVIDNATTLQHYEVNKTLFATYELANNKAKTAYKKEIDFGIRHPADSDWGGAKSLRLSFLSWIYELPYHLVFIAHAREDWEQIEKSREKRLINIKPNFIGTHRIDLPNKFDNVWYTFVSGGTSRSQQYEVQTVKDNIRSAKTRIGGILNDQERNLDLTKVIEEFKQYPKELSKR